MWWVQFTLLIKKTARNQIALWRRGRGTRQPFRSNLRASSDIRRGESSHHLISRPRAAPYPLAHPAVRSSTGRPRLRKAAGRRPDGVLVDEPATLPIPGRATSLQSSTGASGGMPKRKRGQGRPLEALSADSTTKVISGCFMCPSRGPSPGFHESA